MRKPTHDQTELPSEVQRILNARVHPLRAHWAMNVRRVPSEEHVSAAIVGGLAMVEMKAGQPRWIPEADGGRRRRIYKSLQFPEVERADDTL